MASRKLDKDTAERIIMAFRAGADEVLAAGLVGITHERLEAALAADAKLRKAVDQARAEVEMVATGGLRSAAKGNWNAAAFLLRERAADAELARLRELTTDQGAAG